VASAHRTPGRCADYAASAKDRGLKVIVAAAGYSAHLAGALAAWTILPVIGLPLSNSPLSGLDSLLSTAMTPSGVPVATVALDGAVNAAILACQILALSDPALALKLVERQKSQAEAVAAASAALSLA
jgi:phosphoribosylaminoimidazole carboxylase PurE protein